MRRRLEVTEEVTEGVNTSYISCIMSQAVFRFISDFFIDNNRVKYNLASEIVAVEILIGIFLKLLQ